MGEDFQNGKCMHATAVVSVNPSNLKGKGGFPWCQRLKPLLWPSDDIIFFDTQANEIGNVLK